MTASYDPAMPVIERFCIDLAGSELRDHCAARVAYHAQMAADYKDEMGRLLQLERKAEEDTRSISKVRNNSPTDTLDTSLRNHERKARWFGFIAKHFNMCAIYRLYHDDQQHLEIASGHGY